MRASALRVAVIGGGAFVPALGEALARSPLPPLELRLAARRRDRLEVIAAHTAHRLAEIRRDFSVTACGSIAEAVEGARAVVLLVRIGGHAARAHDEAFPRAFGLVGDEGLGPGGFANAWRTAPPLAEMAQLIRASAPGAAVINLVAPLGVTTRLLLDEGLDAIGVCELPEVTLAQMAAAAGTDPGAYRYGGLNHLGWFWDVPSELLRAAVASGLADGETSTRFGAAPLHYYYDVFAPEAAARLGRRRDHDRAAWLSALSDRLIAQFGETPGATTPDMTRRPTPWFERAAVPVLCARLAGVPYRGFVNVRNEGLWPALPRAAVIEVAATIDARGAHPIAPERAPAAVERFSRAAAHAEMLAYRAARTRSADRLEEAIRALPLPISREQASDLAKAAIAPISEP